MLEHFIKLYEEGQRFVVFDVETVGSLPFPTIVEIGAVEAGKEYNKEFRTFQKVLRFRPSSWKPYSRELRIHQIPIREIENGEERLATLREFCQFIEGATLICHTSYDVRAIKSNIELEGETSLIELPIWQKYVDSCRIAQKVCPHLPSSSLGYLTEHFGLKNPQAHRALADAITTKRVLGKLLKHHYQNST